MVMKYEVTAVNSGVVTVRYEDGSWAEVPLLSDMTPEQVDALILTFGPKNHAVPSFISVGYTGAPQAAAPDDVPSLPAVDTTMAWFTARTDAYGPPSAQLEYITENGLEAWQAYVAQVKARYPHPEETQA